MRKPNHTSHSILAIMLAPIFVTACGGGISASTEVADASTAVLEEATRRPWKTPVKDKTAPAPTPPAPTPTAPTPTPATVAPITLGNLPPDGTTQTNAAIGHTGDATYTVYCRLDAYAPVPCPNPFELGKTHPLSAGQHTVDYYAYSGTALDVSEPAVSYSWNIVAATTPAPTTPAPTTPAPTTPAPTTSTAMAAAPVPAPTAVSGSSAQWDGSTPIVVNGTQMIAPVADPNGSGRKVNLHRITQGGASIYGGQRSEILWLGKQEQLLYPGRDYWMAFAVQRKVGETFGATTSYDSHLVFQTHTPQPGDTQPDIALFASAQTGKMGWRVAYNTSGNVDSNGWMSTEGNPWVNEEALPAPGAWVRYVVHYRPGYNSTQQPRLQVWRAKTGAAYEQIVEHTGFNTYNTSKTGAGPSYPRIGLYKWTDSAWTSSSLAWYLTPLYFGEGGNLLESAKASMAGL